MNSSLVMLGYDYGILSMRGVKVPLHAKIQSHRIVVGSTNSGKSSAILYWIYKASKLGCEFYIADFKQSHEFEGITSYFAEFEACYALIEQFYQEFLNIAEGGSGKIKILLIDEIAGLLTYYATSQDGKKKADRVRNIMASILMLGRSRNCFLWLSMQRYSATVFPASSGAADNFQICVGLGRLTVEGRKGLFAGEHFDGEETLRFGQGEGIILVEGQPLRGIVIPTVSKKKLLVLLQK